MLFVLSAWETSETGCLSVEQAGKPVSAESIISRRIFTED